jgi:hypothetical protein
MIRCAIFAAHPTLASLDLFYKTHIDALCDEMIESNPTERARVCRIGTSAAIENIVGVDRQT